MWNNKKCQKKRSCGKLRATHYYISNEFAKRRRKGVEEEEEDKGEDRSENKKVFLK